MSLVNTQTQLINLWISNKDKIDLVNWKELKTNPQYLEYRTQVDNLLKEYNVQTY